MSPLSAFIYALRITCDFLAVVAFVSAIRRHSPFATAHPAAVSSIFPRFSPRFPSDFFWNCTRDFRSHWIKGKSKLNCPSEGLGRPNQKIYDRARAKRGPDTGRFPAPFSHLPISRALSFHLAANIRSVKWLCGWFYITLTDSPGSRVRIIAQRGTSAQGLSPCGAGACVHLIFGSFICAAANMNVKCAFVSGQRELMIILSSWLSFSLSTRLGLLPSPFARWNRLRHAFCQLI